MRLFTWSNSMSTRTTRVQWFSGFPKFLAVATLSFAALGTSAPAFGQEKSEQDLRGAGQGIPGQDRREHGVDRQGGRR